VVMLAVIGGFWSLKRRTVETVQNKNSDDARIAAVVFLEKDTDEDGLKDWEEKLWKTDLQKADTDGDGTPDGEEIRLGRDPLTLGPDDRLDQDTIKSKISTGTPEKLTETDKISREFMTRYIELKKETGKISAEDAENLAISLLQKHNLDLKPKEYGLSDLVTATSSDSFAVRAYGNAVGAILIKHSPKNSESELDIVTRAAKAGSPEGAEASLKKLDPIINGYSAIIADLLALPIPEGAEIAHLPLLQSLSGLLEGLKGLRALTTNSIQAMPALSLYRDSAENLGIAVQGFGDYFKKHGVSFTKKESGYVLTKLAL